MRTCVSCPLTLLDICIVSLGAFVVSSGGCLQSLHMHKHCCCSCCSNLLSLPKLYCHPTKVQIEVMRSIRFIFCLNWKLPLNFQAGTVRLQEQLKRLQCCFKLLPAHCSSYLISACSSLTADILWTVDLSSVQSLLSADQAVSTGAHHS